MDTNWSCLILTICYPCGLSGDYGRDLRRHGFAYVRERRRKGVATWGMVGNLDAPTPAPPLYIGPVGCGNLASPAPLQEGWLTTSGRDISPKSAPCPLLGFYLGWLHEPRGATALVPCRPSNYSLCPCGPNCGTLQNFLETSGTIMKNSRTFPEP
jgi:hypothetical protein